MASMAPRDRTVFLPVVRGMYDKGMTDAVKTTLGSVARDLGMDGILPAGLIQSDADLRTYFDAWRADLSRINGLIAFSADFMQERRIMDAVRLLPEDVPLFLIAANDDPRAMVEGKFGDSLCGSLSVHHNVRMVGRRLIGSCRIDASNYDCVRDVLARYKMIIDGAEALRHMRVAMLGVNPDPFATTFANLPLLFKLGFSLHTYELLDLWGDVVLGKRLASDAKELEAELGNVRLDQPVRRDDPRVAAARELIADAGVSLPKDDAKADLIARCFVWIEALFERDGIDAGAMHCWPQFGRYFGMQPCAVGMLSNLILRKPVVCEVDVCHAIMAKLGWEMTGEPAVILDINNNGWDPRIFNVFHCSQTPPTWLVDGGEVLDGGTVQGVMQAVPFTAVSSATSSDTFHATVFTGHFLTVDPGLRGSSGWAFVPNCQDVLKAIQETGIHHFVAMKGAIATEVADVLRFKGLAVEDMSCDIPPVAEIEADLPKLGAASDCQCPVYSE